MRIYNLTRTTMYPEALDFILEQNSNFEVSKQIFKEADQSRVYTRLGTTSKKYENICNKINSYLNKHYLMYYLDYTSEKDECSRNEAILIVKKPVGDYGEDFMYYTPDFTKDIIKVFYR